MYSTFCFQNPTILRPTNKRRQILPASSLSSPPDPPATAPTLDSPSHPPASAYQITFDGQPAFILPHHIHAQQATMQEGEASIMEGKIRNAKKRYDVY